MKKIILGIVAIVLILLSIAYFYNQEAKYNNSWHVVVKNSYINLREEPSSFSKKIGQIKSGESFSALEIKITSNYIWYKIKVKNVEGWVANTRDNLYLEDYNDPNDYTPPTLKFYDEIYHTYSIDTINYSDLEVKDDKPNYVITHIVYADKTDSNLYWIIYTVTDQGNNTVSKTRQIDFTIQPTKNSLEYIQDK